MRPSLNRPVVAAAFAVLFAASSVPAQSPRDSTAIVQAVIPQALLHAKHQGPRIDTLIAFRNNLKLVPDNPGYHLLRRAAASQPIATDELPPRCAWTGGSPTSGMGIRVSLPAIESGSANIDVELLCMKGATAFAWVFRYRLEHTGIAWIVREVDELEIS